MDPLNLVIAAIAMAVSGYVASSFYKAGKFKAITPMKGLIEAGFGWVEKTPAVVVRLIAWLELLGALGILAAPIASYFIPGFAWTQLLGVLAAFGLALTMVGAFILHLVRGEAKYMWKANLSLFVFSVVAGILQWLVVVPLV